MAATDTKWESGFVPEPKAWFLSSKIMAGMAALITLMLTAICVLVVMGFNALERKGTESHLALCAQLNKIEAAALEDKKLTNAVLMKVVEDVAVVKTNQQARMIREMKEFELKRR